VADTNHAEVLERAVAAWNRGDLRAHLELFDPDIMLHGAPRGIAGVRSMYEGNPGGFVIGAPRIIGSNGCGLRPWALFSVRWIS
jgi:hypothetical protein